MPAGAAADAGGAPAISAGGGGLQFDQDVVPLRNQPKAGPPATPQEMRVAEFLRSCDLFAEFSLEDCQRLAHFGREIHAKPGQVLFAEGQTGRELYVVERGEVAILKKLPEGPEVLLVRFGPKSFFGEMAVIDGGARSGTARATQASDLVAFDQDALDTMLSQEMALLNQVLWSLLRVLSKRLRETNGQLQVLVSRLADATHHRPNTVPHVEQ